METTKPLTPAQQIRKTHKKLRSGEMSANEWWAFLEGMPRNIVKKAISDIVDAEQRLQRYKSSPLFRNKIRKYANHRVWTDTEPFEVVKVISPRKVLVRRMEATQTVFPQSFHIGGFSANCSDQNRQDYEYASTEEEPFAITLTKKGWGGGQYHMADKPRKFYDYNF